MSAPHLTLRLRQPPPGRLDMTRLAPGRLAGLSTAEVERLTLQPGRQPLATGDLFQVRGKPGAAMRIESDCDRLDAIGAALEDGEIRVIGRAGAYLGRGMRAGRIGWCKLPAVRPAFVKERFGISRG